MGLLIAALSCKVRSGQCHFKLNFTRNTAKLIYFWDDSYEKCKSKDRLVPSSLNIAKVYTGRLVKCL